MNRPGLLRGTLAPLPRNGYTGIADFALSSLLYLLRDRVLWPIESTSDSGGGEGEGRDVFRLSSGFHDDGFLERGRFFRESLVFFIEDFILFYSSRIFVVFMELDRLCIID